jgi:hypothetical protein
MERNTTMGTPISGQYVIISVSYSRPVLFTDVKNSVRAELRRAFTHRLYLMGTSGTKPAKIMAVYLMVAVGTPKGVGLMAALDRVTKHYVDFTSASSSLSAIYRGVRHADWAFMRLNRYYVNFFESLSYTSSVKFDIQNIVPSTGSCLPCDSSSFNFLDILVLP